jgi:hypothetical protein
MADARPVDAYPPVFIKIQRHRSSRCQGLARFVGLEVLRVDVPAERPVALSRLSPAFKSASRDSGKIEERRQRNRCYARARPMGMGLFHETSPLGDPGLTSPQILRLW